MSAKSPLPLFKKEGEFLPLIKGGQEGFDEIARFLCGSFAPAIPC